MPHMHAPLMAQLAATGVRYPCAMSGANPGQSFGNLIAAARKAKGWSQDDLEQATIDENGEHVSRSTISRWERGQADRPEPAHIRMVCKALGIDPRLAVVALGYLTVEEIQPRDAAPLDEEVEEILRILPLVNPAERRAWINYLRYLQDQQTGPQSNAG